MHPAAEKARKHREASQFIQALAFVGNSTHIDVLAEEILILSWLARTKDAQLVIQKSWALHHAHSELPAKIRLLLSFCECTLAASDTQALKTWSALLMQHMQALPKTYSSLYVRMYILQGYHAVYQGETEQALSHARTAVSIAQKHCTPLYQAQALHALAEVYHRSASYQLAHTTWEQVFAIRKKIFPPLHVDYARTLDSWACTERILGQYSQALTKHRTALSIYGTLFDAQHPAIATCLHAIAQIYARLGNHPLAIFFMKQSLENSILRFGKNHVDVWITRFELYRIQYMHQPNATHKQNLFRAQRALQDLLPEHHPTLTSVQRVIHQFSSEDDSSS